MDKQLWKLNKIELTYFLCSFRLCAAGKEFNYFGYGTSTTNTITITTNSITINSIKTTTTIKIVQHQKPKQNWKYENIKKNYHFIYIFIYIKCVIQKRQKKEKKKINNKFENYVYLALFMFRICMWYYLLYFCCTYLTWMWTCMPHYLHTHH